jgi:sugar lactone lactonase YvrE
MAWLVGFPPAVITVEAATPQLKRIFPQRVSEGAPSFTVRLEGKRFEEGATVLLDGVPLDTSRISRNGKLLLAEVPESAVASPGTHILEARNPDGSVSASKEMDVVARDPDFLIRLQTNATQEDSSLAAIPSMRSDRISSSTKVEVWGKGQQTLLSGEFLLYAIPGDFLTEVASLPVVARDKQGNFSNTEIFFVVKSPAQIDVIEPDTIEVGTEDFELKVFGEYTPAAKIVVNGVELPTVVDDKDRVSAIVPGSFRAQPAQLIVRIEEGGSQSDNAILTVTPSSGPFIYTIAPARVRVGENRLTLDIVGANFTTGSEATIDGAEARVRSRTRRRLTIAVPRELLETPGTHTVQATDSEGNPTNVVTFEVVPDVEVSTVIGSDRGGFNTGCVSGDEALLRRPRRVVFASDGLIYFTDQQNHAIRSINPATLEVCTVAGALGEDGYNDSGNSLNKPPTFSFPNGLAVASDGTIFVSENGNNVIRRIVRNGDEITVDTIAGTFRVIDRPGEMERLNSTKLGIQSYRDSTAFDSSFRLPDEMVIGPDGTLFIADAANHAIRRIRNQNGELVVETLAGNGVPGFADGQGRNARFNTPTGMAISLDGQFLFVTDTNNGRIRRVEVATGRVETYAGSGALNIDDGPASQAGFVQPIGVAIDSDGTLYVSELGAADIRRIEVSGDVSTLAGGDNNNFKDGPGVSAKFSAPRGLAIDRQNGILYVADTENLRIRSIALR